MREQSQKDEMAAALRGDFQRLRQRGVATSLGPAEEEAAAAAAAEPQGASETAQAPTAETAEPAQVSRPEPDPTGAGAEGAATPRATPALPVFTRPSRPAAPVATPATVPVDEAVPRPGATTPGGAQEPPVPQREADPTAADPTEPDPTEADPTETGPGAGAEQPRGRRPWLARLLGRS